MKFNDNGKWVVRTVVPGEVYTDREEFLEYFHEAALDAVERKTMSTVLLGQRRMGKTEIFKRVVNRLFFEQDPNDPKAVVPVYYSFPDTSMNERRFAKNYLENFMRYYVGFYTSRPELVWDAPKEEELLALIQEARSSFPFTRTLDLLLRKHEAVVKRGVYLPQQDALEIPRRISDIDDSTIVMFLDESQNTRLPEYNFEIVGFMQEAVESPTCPHFVTGSAMSILSREIIGRGALFGRFDGMDIKPLSGYWGAALSLRAARSYGAKISNEIAPVIADRCGGNPFYITAVVRRAAKLKMSIPDEESLNKILAVDLSSGFIWAELRDQVKGWIQRINEHGITKWVLYLSALDENTQPEKRGRLNVERIQRELMKREGKDIPLDDIRDVLIRLSRGDLLEYLELGGEFYRVKDPILLEFLKVWGRIEIERQSAEKVREDLGVGYSSIKRKFNEYKGYLAEVHMSQALLNARGKTLPGAFFNVEEEVRMPRDFFYIEHRMRQGSGKGREIDVYGAAASQRWICQSKWLKKDKVGVGVLREMMVQAEDVRKEKEEDPRPIRLWLFANNGLTTPAKKLAEKHGILWSTRKEFDRLLTHLGLRILPEV
ncbi:MAG: hypothetical protein GY859_44130 [Desulfobacterales bacterium]|nr:hypothetical protein [Desulfobacterales bacterium]